MNRLISFILVLIFPFITNHAFAQTHEHGSADMGIVSEGSALVVAFSSPLFNLVGFEHLPSTDQERQVMRHMKSRLNNASEWLIPNPEAGCLIEAIEHKTTYTQTGDEPQHGTLEARIELACSNPEKLNRFDIALFSQFEDIQRLRVHLQVPSQQIDASLTPYTRTITW